MEAVKEIDQDAAEESEEKGLAEDEICRDVSYMVGLQVDRSAVDALLDISAEYSMKEQDSCDLCSSSDWEEAVQGWNRFTALSCMFLPPKYCKKTKNDEQDPHCLLCVDIGPPEALNVDRPPEFCPESHGNPQDRGVNNATPSGLPTELYSPTAGSPPLKEDHQHQPGDKMAENTGVRDALQPSPPHHLNSIHPALMSHHFDLAIPINNFKVLPPVKTPQLSSQRVVQPVCYGESAAGGTEETEGADTVTNPEPSKDPYRVIAPPRGMYCQSQEKRHLLSTFSLPILKRYGMPLGKITDTMHRTTVSIGKHWKQAVRTGSEYSRHERSTTPQLPILLGTKVPIVVSSQRPL
ncbi:unnamed protein product [Lota lota]